MRSIIFSVIVPTYQDNIRLNLCLQALVKQRFKIKEFEVILVNNDPTNPVLIEKDFFLQLDLRIINEFTPGSYAARNAGIKAAKGLILAFTDSDCLPDSNWLSNAKKYFDNDKKKEIGIIAGQVTLFFRNNDNLSKTEIYEKYTGFTFEAYVKEGTCGAGNWFSYKSILEEFGGFNSKLKSNGDTELSYKISRKYKLIYAPEVIVRHPSRFKVSEIVYKYRRLLGGVYSRRFEGQDLRFLLHLLNYTFRRIRFLLKKVITVRPKESYAIAIVTWYITLGGWQEYFDLIKGKNTKR